MKAMKPWLPLEPVPMPDNEVEPFQMKLSDFALELECGEDEAVFEERLKKLAVVRSSPAEIAPERRAWFQAEADKLSPERASAVLDALSEGNSVKAALALYKAKMG